MKRIEVEDAKRILKTVDDLEGRVYHVIDFLRRNQMVNLPLEKGDLWILRHGIIYPSHGISIIKRGDVPHIECPAWDGYDAEPFDNAEFAFPFDWINLYDDELAELVHGAEKDGENGKE